MLLPFFEKQPETDSRRDIGLSELDAEASNDQRPTNARSADSRERDFIYVAMRASSMAS
jgi:hypothetical protein